MDPLTGAVAVFLLVGAAVFGTYIAVTRLPAVLDQQRLEKRIREAAGQTAPDARVESIVKRAIEGPLPSVDRLFARSGRISGISALIEQSGVNVSVSSVLLAAAALGLLVAFGLATALRMAWMIPIGGCIGCAIPFLYLRHRRKKRIRRFEEQFPEALDLLSRAIRAGHAFTTAMGMVADDASDPVGPEFKKSFDEQNFGLPLKDALNNMAERVPSLDVRFFVTAVLIQRETGGNLSEILDNLAHVVRERFKILRQVRVYTAHGRLTGYVLLALPPSLAIALMFINPEFMGLLFQERMGHIMLTIAVVLQIIGYFWIRRVVKIEV